MHSAFCARADENHSSVLGMPICCASSLPMSWRVIPALISAGSQSLGCCPVLIVTASQLTGMPMAKPHACPSFSIKHNAPGSTTLFAVLLQTLDNFPPSRSARLHATAKVELSRRGKADRAGTNSQPLHGAARSGAYLRKILHWYSI